MQKKSTDIRQEEIKKAVLSIIRRDGLKSLSTKNLATEVGLSEGAIFRHFKTKKEILTAVIDDVSRDLLSKLRTTALEATSPPQRLYKLLCTTVSYLLENNGITILLFAEASQNNDDGMKAKLNLIFNTQRQLAAKIISDGIAESIWDESVSVENVSMLYMAIPISLNIELILNKDGFHQENFCRKMMILIERILKK